MSVIALVGGIYNAIFFIGLGIYTLFRSYVYFSYLISSLYYRDMTSIAGPRNEDSVDSEKNDRSKSYSLKP
jgi:hypothetical protein